MHIQRKSAKRLSVVNRLNKKNPDKYCWSDLYDMAICKDREERKELKESAREMTLCKVDIEKHGSCWCGKFTKEDYMEETKC